MALRVPDNSERRAAAAKNGPDAAALIELLEQQRAIYVKLQQLGRTQAELIAAGDAQPLLYILEQRQHLIDQLLQVNAGLEPFRSDWPGVWSRLDPATRVRVGGLIDHVQDLLEQVLRQDARDRESLGAQRDRLGSELSQLRRGQSINRAYGRDDDRSEPRYTDQRG